jgi:hypothetical protein
MCYLMHTAVTSATVTLDVVYTLLHLLGISNRSSFHQCHMECMFSFENGLENVTVSNASEFFGSTLNIRDNDSAMVCCI